MPSSPLENNEKDAADKNRADSDLCFKFVGLVWILFLPSVSSLMFAF